mmetsp:Transcript_17201/g.55035  ORF Transcript_17201/g.55035 Transcript_17201/m.55035 type:complete len:207 (+) Transcript_17201:718-1338(+)
MMSSRLCSSRSWRPLRTPPSPTSSSPSWPPSPSSSGSGWPPSSLSRDSLPSRSCRVSRPSTWRSSSSGWCSPWVPASPPACTTAAARTSWERSSAGSASAPFTPWRRSGGARFATSWRGSCASSSPARSVSKSPSATSGPLRSSPVPSSSSLLGLGSSPLASLPAPSTSGMERRSAGPCPHGASSLSSSPPLLASSARSTRKRTVP